MLARVSVLLLGSCNALNIASMPRHVRRVVSRASDLSMIETEEKGEFGTTDFVMSFKKDGESYSPWHDAPLELEGGMYNMLTEIPKMTFKKMEVRAGWRPPGS